MITFCLDEKPLTTFSWQQQLSLRLNFSTGRIRPISSWEHDMILTQIWHWMSRWNEYTLGFLWYLAHNFLVCIFLFLIEKKQDNLSSLTLFHLGGGLFDPLYHECICRIYRPRTRFTKIHDFVPFGICQDPVKLLLKFFSKKFEILDVKIFWGSSSIRKKWKNFEIFFWKKP